MKTFPHARYDALVEETIANLKKLGQLKGGEYAGDDDRLANFRRNGEAIGLPMEAIWHTYAAKHWDAVTQYVKDLVTGKSRERLEPLSGRLDDIIVYCILFKAMLEERAQPAKSPIYSGVLPPSVTTPFPPHDMVWLQGQNGNMIGDP